MGLRDHTREEPSPAGSDQVRCPPRFARREWEAGFSLPEALVAAVILGLSLASVLAVVSHGCHYLRDMRRMARSSQVLQQKMEDIRLWNWTKLQTNSTTFTDPHDAAGLFAGTLTRTPYAAYLGSATVLRVTLTVTWTNQADRVMTNSLSTLVCQGGLNKYIF